jgi:hypothetical protein
MRRMCLAARYGRVGVLAGALLIAAAAHAAASDLRVIDLDGRAVDPLPADPKVRATVFVFTTTDCPIANRYAPDIRDLFESFARRGVRFWLVYANPAESSDAIREHVSRFGYPMPAVRDPRHELIKRLAITVTPESAVLDSQGRTLYRGRIDDRYVDFGVERPTATRKDLQEALKAVLSGTAVSTPTTRAVGCIVADFRPVTFATDLAPLIFDRCVSCHRPAGTAPFSLLTYEDVRRRASQIAAVTAARFMPPWKAEPDPTGFVGQKPLSDDEIDLIGRWVNEGAREGNARDTPSAPRFEDRWQLGRPDLIVSIDEPFTLPAQGTDVFRIFAIRLPVTSARFVTGLEFHPGNPRVVHHANIRLDPTPGSRMLDTNDPAPGYDGLMPRSAVYPEGHFLGWTPGQIAPLVPETMAWRLEPGTDLVVQLHMQPSGAIETVKPFIGLFFGNEPPTRIPTILRLGSQGIDIPPGEKRYTIDDSYVLPVDVELHAVQPHGHYRLREALGKAVFPDGTARPLITIKNWDFRWQHVYRYTKPLVLPKGTRVSMHYEYDNSRDNPRNPVQPPQRVAWGQRSFDEMGDLWFQFVARTESDRRTLQAEAQRKMTTEDIVGYETMLRGNEKDVELHDDVAMLYLTIGAAADAVRHFGASADLRPGVAAAHFNLATALTMAGRLDEAIASFRQALALRPDYASAHNNLGMALQTQEKHPDALHHLREAVRLDAGNVQAHRNLAWTLATDSGTDARAAREAVDAAERAAALTDRRDVQVLDALAAAYAAAGEFDRAVAAAERAIAIASDQALRREIGERLTLYRRRSAYRLR